jgi:3D-(3,5/4)-trihydroxycyclohexane-1,2-dione acylhydrolase (decyclizing)
MSTLRLTMAQALVGHLAAQRIELDDGSSLSYCAGVWAIYGHGNVAGLGEALAQHRERLPVLRAHN